MTIGSKTIYCIICNQIHDVSIVKEYKEINYKDSLIHYEAEMFKCLNVQTNNEFITEYQQKRNLKVIINKYREQNNLISVQELQDFRKKYKLSQEEFSLILGFDKNTIYDIETIRPQTIHENDLILKVIRQPIFFINRLKNTTGIISNSRRLILESKLLIEAKEKNEFFFE